MKTITMLLGACALAALSAGTATAGPCTAEIDNVTKLLASKDAGAGPTAGGASPGVADARTTIRSSRARHDESLSKNATGHLHHSRPVLFAARHCVDLGGTERAMANALEFRILENSGGWHPEKIMGLDFKVRSCSLSVRFKHQRDRLHILEASMNV